MMKSIRAMRGTNSARVPEYFRVHSLLTQALRPVRRKSMNRIDLHTRYCILPFYILLVSSALSTAAHADHMTLKNGLRLEGVAGGIQAINKPFPDRDAAFEAELRKAGIQHSKPLPMRLLDDGVRRYMVDTKQIVELVQEDELARIVSYKIRHEKSARTSGIYQVGAFLSVEPFDPFGRRTVTLNANRNTLPIIQGITELRPDYARLESLSHKWDYSIDTNTVPGDVIDALLQQSTNRSDSDERKAVVLFFIQAKMYPQAKRELIGMQQDFTDLHDWCTDYLQQIEESEALLIINEIARRQASGQHALAYNIAKNFPADKVSAAVLRQANELTHQYDVAIENRDQALMMLDVLQAQLPMEVALQLKPLQAKLADELHFEAIERLQPFLRSDLDDTLPPDQKLALAYSGWLMGSAEAGLDLKEAIRLWESRYLVLEFLRTDRDPDRDEGLLNQLKAIEGLSVERLAKMIPLLPLAFEAPEIASAEVVEIEVPGHDSELAVKYSIMLPPEYSPQHRYPVIIALRGEGRTFENTVRWWGGDDARPGWAQRRGYIVIAPHYSSAAATEHDYSGASHKIVIESLKHVRKLFRVDSDRVFLSGHGMGGDACFDIALSNPGLFAGVIPIAGIIDKYAQFYWQNAPQLAWYIVAGERDRDSKTENATNLNKMMRQGQDILYCEYKERGFESFHEEQERIFQWMQTHRRASIKEAQNFEVGGLRITDNNFHWLEAEALPAQLYEPISWQKSVRKTPRMFEGKIYPGGTIYIKHPGDKTTVHLSPELFDFNARCELHINNRVVFNEYISPSISAMLNDLRERSDREQLYWVRIESNYRNTVVK